MNFGSQGDFAGKYHDRSQQIFGKHAVIGLLVPFIEKLSGDTASQIKHQNHWYEPPEQALDSHFRCKHRGIRPEPPLVDKRHLGYSSAVAPQERRRIEFSVLAEIAAERCRYAVTNVSKVDQ